MGTFPSVRHGKLDVVTPRRTPPSQPDRRLLIPSVRWHWRRRRWWPHARAGVETAVVWMSLAIDWLAHTRNAFTPATGTF